MSGCGKSFPLSVWHARMKAPRQVLEHRPGLTTVLLDLTERRG